jgi:hypothetical protein
VFEWDDPGREGGGGTLGCLLRARIIGEHTIT